MDKIDRLITEIGKIDHHKKLADRFPSIFDINRLIVIDFNRLLSIFIEYRKYRLVTIYVLHMENVKRLHDI